MTYETDLTRDQKAAVISEGIALAVLNDDDLRQGLVSSCVNAILNDCGYSPQQAVEEYEKDPHDFLWESCAGLSVRDVLYLAWQIPVRRDEHQGSLLLDDLDTVHRTLALVCGYDDTVLWQRIARDIMPSPAILREWAIRTGVIDRG